MESATTTQLNVPSIVPTTAQTIGRGPTLSSQDCAKLDGTPLLPGSDASFQCGTKTTNRTLVESCCNGEAVRDYLGCFMYCSVNDWSGSVMNDMISCLGNNSVGESSVDIEYGTFCQGELQRTVAGAASSNTRKTPTSFVVTLVLLLLFFADAVRAQDSCSFAIEEDSVVIRQGPARRLANAGTGCPETRPCIVDLSGSTMITGANRTINGQNGAGSQYDSFFEVLGRTTNPPRLFPVTTFFSVQHWGVGMAGRTTFPTWAPLLYCVNGTASGCGEVDGYVEACGALFQSGTGLEDDLVPQGLFLRDSIGS